MSTIGEVRTAEKKVKQIIEQLEKFSPKDDTTLLRAELRKANDEYVKCVLELRLP